MHVFIPARFASTRLPGKPLADIAGKPMIRHVYELAQQCGARSVVIATDDERIRAAARGFGAQVCMTSERHRSGTERIAEAIQLLGIADEEIVVNLQGDEPLMPPALIRHVAETLAVHNDAVAATACCAIRDDVELHDPNVVKVVCDSHGYALYFSRAPIPYPRERGPSPAHRHLGLYAYRAGYVARYLALTPSPHELTEQLEQLRILWHGERVAVWTAHEPPVAGVDSPEDLHRVRQYFREKRNG